ncbi:MAG TPA: phosphotransferase [Stellaceae bacterium]|nr:phosphotransferase [Stellaceae bacterium]
MHEVVSERGETIEGFLSLHGWGGVDPVLLAGDASFRRYYRLTDGSRRRAVLMDAPPPHEAVGPYIAIAAALRDYGFSAPEIFAEDDDVGLALIEDFGDDTYTRLLAAGSDERALYGLAIDTLIALQRTAEARGLPELPHYDEERLLAETMLLVDWYAPAVLGHRLPAEDRDAYAATWRRLLAPLHGGAPTLVLRDFHVDNLMLLRDRLGVRRCGLLDFQDAVRGPASYDLVSLIEDARRDVSAELREAMMARYLAAFPAIDRAEFRRSAAILAVQRNCKIIGIFTRLARRDAKPQYLGHIPRVWRLLVEDLRDPALAPLAAWIDRHLPPRFRRVPADRGAA